MLEKKILFDGCSFTANNGFTAENQPRFHWPYLVSRHYQTEFKNLAQGGDSNIEIFNRVIQNYTVNHYNLVVVQWSNINRYWAYHRDDNVDDFTIISPGAPRGYRCDQDYTLTYSKLHQTYFSNNYVNLRQWLCHVIALAGFFDSQNQPYVFIKGFENYVSEFKDIGYKIDYGFINLSSDVKKILDFDNRPDDYVLDKIVNIQNLLDKVCNLNWLNFDSASFFDAAVDLSDDQCHPGPKSNLSLANQLIAYCNRKNLLTND